MSDISFEYTPPSTNELFTLRVKDLPELYLDETERVDSTNRLNFESEINLVDARVKPKIISLMRQLKNNYNTMHKHLTGIRYEVTIIK